MEKIMCCAGNDIFFFMISISHLRTPNLYLILVGFYTEKRNSGLDRISHC